MDELAASGPKDPSVPAGAAGRESAGWSLATLCVHAGHRPDPSSPSVVGPTVRSVTFLQTGAARRATKAGRWDEALVYARYGSPTVAAVERRLAALEGAHDAALFASGMAAMHAALVALARPGRPIAVAEQLYGGTLDLLQEGLVPLGFTTRPFDVGRPETFASAFDGVDLVLCESVSNPTLAVADLPRIAAAAHEAGARLLVDATFATPVLQRPLELGADVVMHSATKYMAGHSDVTAGVLAGSDLRDARAWRRRAGGVPDPEAASLVDRGLKTLVLRVRAQCAGAERLAHALAAHPAVRRVWFPGLPEHPSHALAQRLLAAPGAMVSFELAAGDAAAEAFVEGLALALDAPSLGGVETIVSLPALMSHAHLTPERRTAVGIGPGFVRVSVGIEDPGDVIRDFERALDALG